MNEAGWAVQPESEPDALPVWSLADLYAGPADPQITRDLDWARTTAEDLRAAYAGRLGRLSGEELGNAVTVYEALIERLHRVLSFAQLYFASDMGDPARGRFLQTIQEQFNVISSEALFFTLELNKIDEGTLETQLSAAPASRYGPWIRDLQMFRPYQLDDALEKLILEKSVTGATAWVRLFDQIQASLRISVGHRTLTLADTLNLLESPDAELRRQAAKALGRSLGERDETVALIVNTLAKDKEIEDRWRGYPHPVASRNLSNKVNDEVVEALAGAIQGAYEELAHRYYKLKARWFGRETLDYWDRNAPLPGRDHRRYRWQEARAIVLHAFRRFDPAMAAIADRFFIGRWIDALPRPGKESGAFCHPVVPSSHPYVLLNFYGRTRDVMTLAHELGHGVHQVLASEQGALMADTPLTLAESASVFGEMLVFRALLEEQRDPEGRRRLLASKVESMLNTVVRQIAFHEFERRIHEERRQSELSAERLGEIWLSVQRASLGPALNFDDEYKYYWSYIQHFVHSPFYVYAYAFGDCLVNSLYDVYSEGLPGFAEKYFNMLRAGGTLRHDELLRPFGLDASDPGFWRRGLNVIIGFIDELEALT